MFISCKMDLFEWYNYMSVEFKEVSYRYQITSYIPYNIILFRLYIIHKALIFKLFKTIFYTF